MAVRPPYPGLRSFRRSETDLFFGREDNVDEIVDRLLATRFVAVLGASGSGKSSLVRTGVLEAIELGLLKTDPETTSWQIADLRPGDRPRANLARALLESRDGKAIDLDELEALTAMLRRGPRSILEWCRAGHLREGASLLILVDQFEELFNYQSYYGSDQAQAFVNLLIESVNTKLAGVGQPRIFVIVTMRSEYLGACSLIDGLAEIINRGQYLTPRLKRSQCQSAIEQPAAVQGVHVEPALVNRLLNDLASFAPWDDPGSVHGDAEDATAKADRLERLARRADQLPLLQHVLNRLWSKSVERGDVPLTLKLDDYNQGDGLHGMLSAHADEILSDLARARDDGIRATAEAVFRALVGGTSVATAVRRPTTIGKLVEVSGSSSEDVLAVVEAYSASDSNFLTTGSSVLTPDVTVDISHESLIRQWGRLRGWVETEAAAALWWRGTTDQAKNWLSLVRQAASQKRSQSFWRRIVEHFRLQGTLLRGASLAQTQLLFGKYSPTPSWAEQYGGGYADFLNYLQQSKRVERSRTILLGLSAFCVVAASTFILIMVMANHRVSRERELSDSHLQRRLVDSILQEVAAHQRPGEEAQAGALLARLLEPFVDDFESNLRAQSLDERRRQRLISALRAQHAAMRRQDKRNVSLLEAGISTGEFRPGLVPDLLHSRPTYLYFNPGAGEAATIVGVSDKSLKLYGAGRDGTWAHVRTMDISSVTGNRALAGNPAIVVFDRGASLAVVDGDDVYYGKIAETEKPTNPAPDGSKAANPEPSRVTVARIERRRVGIQASREQEKGVPVPKGLPFTTVLNCNRERPNFLALNPEGAWLLTVDGERAIATKLLDGARMAYSVDPESGRYAVAAGGRGKIGRCGLSEAGTEVEPKEFAVGDTEDIEFTADGILALVRSALQVRFVDVRANSSTQNPIQFDKEATLLPPGRSYFRTASDRRIWMWASDKIDEKTLVLWNAISQIDEGTVEVTDHNSAQMVGISTWIAMLSPNGQLVVRRPVAVSRRSPAELARIILAAGGSDVPQEMADTIEESHRLWKRDLGRHSTTEAPSADLVKTDTCKHILYRTLDAIERLSSVERAGKLGQLARLNCEPTTPGDDDEGDFYAWLAQWKDHPPPDLKTLRRPAASLAARGSAIGLELLAATFDGSPDVATALDIAVARRGARIPYPVLRDARINKESESWPPEIREIASGSSLDGRNDPRLHELRGLWLSSKQPKDALRYLASAQLYYAKEGDIEGIRQAGVARFAAALRLSDEELKQLGDIPLQLQDQPRTDFDAQAALRREKHSLSDDLQTIAANHPPMIKAALLMAAADATSEDGERLALLKKAAEALPRGGSYETLRRGPAPRLAKQLADRGAKEEGAILISKYLTDWSAFELSSNDPALFSVIDSLRIANQTDASAFRSAREYLTKMKWPFVNFTWADSLWNSFYSRNLLPEAEKLLRGMLDRGIDTREVKLAMARTSLGLGIKATTGKYELFAKAVALFGEVPDLDIETSLQYADAVRLRASVMPIDDPSVTAEQALAVVAARQKAKGMYEKLLLVTENRARGDYFRTAVISGLSSTLQLLSTAHAIATGKLIDRDPDLAYKQAVLAMRSVFDQEILFDADHFTDLKASSADSRGLCCLAPESQAEDAWVVAIVAGRVGANGNKGAGACERSATHPYDPRRRVHGGAPTGDAISLCEKESASLVGDEAARNAFLLGRAYAQKPELRDRALKQLARAAGDGYPQAYYNLYYELNVSSARCSLAPALIDRYRYMVMRDSLGPALQILRSYLQPQDDELLEHLQDLARREPSTTIVFPRKTKSSGSDFFYEFVKTKCT